MYLQSMLSVAIVLVLLSFHTEALPFVKFVQEFATKFQRSSVILHIVSDRTTINDCVNW